MCDASVGPRPTVVPVQGSLIFVVIVAIWAAYLVQHWVRRREDAAATRSVDGFSEAMRVLQKRPLLPATELRSPRPHSYAVTPGRAARPTVDVKRALPAGSARPTSPLAARRAATVTASTAASSTAAGAAVTETVATSQVEPMPENRSSIPARRDTSGPSVGQRRLRAGLLLVALLWVPVSIVLAAVGVLMWLSVPFALLTVAAVVVWLRTEAAGDRARRGGARDARASRADDAYADEWADEGFAEEGDRLRDDDTQAIHSHVYAAQASEAPAHRAEQPAARASEQNAERDADRAAPARPAAFFDGQADEVAATAATAATASTVAGAPAEPAAALEPGTWVPVPVPRPTYAMKAKAEPRLTESGIPADVFATPEFADEADELDERGLFARRAASQ